ncbi:diguanylate cyclase [bacterium]
MKILVVDDSSVIRTKLEEVLVGDGYSVMTASDGVEALDIMKNGNFDLLFLDIDMPQMSGLQVLRFLRNDRKYADLPIIMLTGRDRKQDMYWGIETGATAYMTKPFKDEELLEKVSEVLDSTEAGRAVDKESLRASETAAAPEELDETDVIFKAGELQEMQLFKVNLINKIYKIATSQLDLQEACSIIADIFVSVLDFDLAIYLITDDDRVKLYVFVHNPITRDFFMDVRKTMLDEFKKKAGSKDVLWDNIEVNIEDPEHHMLKDGGSETISGIETALLESTGDKFGMLTIARGKEGGEFSGDEIEMCRTIVQQSGLVVNNVRMYEKIKRFAIADGLTGLYNHRYFQEQLEKEYSRARRFNLSLAMIMLDLDNFKDINDTYGHQQGDIILKDIAILMRRTVRDIDLVARYGGEEFAVILPETPKKNAVVVAERIREIIEEHDFINESKRLEVRASLGVSGHPDDDIENRLDLIAKADEALYKAKREGRNRVCLYSPERSDY